MLSQLRGRKFIVVAREAFAVAIYLKVMEEQARIRKSGDLEEFQSIMRQACDIFFIAAFYEKSAAAVGGPTALTRLAEQSIDSGGHATGQYWQTANFRLKRAMHNWLAMPEQRRINDLAGIIRQVPGGPRPLDAARQLDDQVRRLSMVWEQIA